VHRDVSKKDENVALEHRQPTTSSDIDGRELALYE